MALGPRIAVVLCLLLASTAAVAPGLATTPGGAATPQTQADTGITETITVDLQPDGDARWTITKTFNLSSRNETAAFEALAADFENGNTGDLGLDSFREASRLASESTGREMDITNVSRAVTRSGSATNGTGRLTIAFTWTSFGRIDGDHFYIDDVFSTPDGIWFSSLDETQRLVVRPPDGYEFFDAPAPLQNGTIRLTGPREFDSDSLSATFVRRASSNTTNGTTTPTTTLTTTTATTSAGDGGTDGSSAFLAGIATLGIGVAVIGYLLSRREADSGTDESPGPTASADSPDGGPDAAAAVGTEGGDEDDEGDIDEELLSDGERVERLLERNGGRMKQANIVKETGWSNAKVSQLLSSMEDDGQIDKLRIGRENLISFPDEDVTDPEE